MLPILNQSYWRDEAFSVLLAEKSPLQIIYLTIKDQSPPFYYLLLHYWMIIFGKSEVATRSLSLIFHLCLAVAVFFISRKLVKSFLFQSLVTLSVILNPFLLQYAFETRMYTLLAFLTVLAVYFIVLKRYWLASIALALSVLTQNFGVFNCIAIAFWWIYLNSENWKDHRSEVFALFFLPLLAVTSWGFVIWDQWVRLGRGFWIPPVTSQIFLNAFSSYARGDISYPTQYMLLLVSIILFIFGFSYWFLKNKDEQLKFSSLFLSVSLIPIIITYFVSVLFVPLYHQRYLISTAPMLIILIGYFLNKIYTEYSSRKFVLSGVVSAYIILLILSAEQIVQLSTKPAINWGVNQVLLQAKVNDIIVPKDVLNYLETKFYVEENNSILPVYAYSPTGKIPFYIGAILFDKQHIIKEIPKHRRVWQIMPDGGYKLIISKS